MTSDIYCQQNSKSSVDTEYTNDDSFQEKTKDELKEDIAQLEHVNSKVQKQLATCQKDAEETIENLHQQIRLLQLDRDEKEKTNSQLQKRLKFLTEYKVEAGTQTTAEVITGSDNGCLKQRSADSEAHDATDDDNLDRQAVVSSSGEKRHRILILGDSHGRHIAQLLSEDLGPAYSVSGVLKPHANMEQVTANIGDLARGFTKSDLIAVLVGDSHVDVVTDLWDLLRAACSTNLLVGLVPTRVDPKENNLPLLVVDDSCSKNGGGSAYLVPVRRDRLGSLGRGAKKELSSKMSNIVLRVLGESTRLDSLSQ